MTVFQKSREEIPGHRQAYHFVPHGSHEDHDLAGWIQCMYQAASTSSFPNSIKASTTFEEKRILIQSRRQGVPVKLHLGFGQSEILVYQKISIF
jgi:hypothetical protein